MRRCFVRVLLLLCLGAAAPVGAVTHALSPAWITHADARLVRFTATTATAVLPADGGVHPDIEAPARFDGWMRFFDFNADLRVTPDELLSYDGAPFGGLGLSILTDAFFRGFSFGCDADYDYYSGLRATGCETAVSGALTLRLDGGDYVVDGGAFTFANATDTDGQGMLSFSGGTGWASYQTRYFYGEHGHALGVTGRGAAPGGRQDATPRIAGFAAPVAPVPLPPAAALLAAALALTATQARRRRDRAAG